MVNEPLKTVASNAEPTAGSRQYKRYPAYKDSGVEGFDKIPKHWEVLQIGRIGHLDKCNGGTKADEVPEGIPCIRYGDLYMYHTCFIQHSRSYVSTDRVSDYTPVQFGDILFAASGETIDEIGKSAVNLIDTHACCGGDMIRLRPPINANARFMGYAADSSVAAFQKGRMGRGITVMHVYGDELKYLALAIPSPSEQHAIATYLDREIAKIDALVSNKKRLIDLLQEKRDALITRTVTKGLDPRRSDEGLRCPKAGRDSGVLACPTALATHPIRPWSYVWDCPSRPECARWCPHRKGWRRFFRTTSRPPVESYIFRNRGPLRSVALTRW